MATRSASRRRDGISPNEGKMEAKGAKERTAVSHSQQSERRAHLLSRPSPSGCCCRVAPYLCLPLPFDLWERRQERDKFVNASIREGAQRATISAIAGCGFIPDTYIIRNASPLKSGIKRDYINVIIKLLYFQLRLPPRLPFEMPSTSRDHRFDAT